MSGDVVPATRDWSTTVIAGCGEDDSPRSFSVSGEVKLGNENENPQLSMSDPPSTDPSVLSLDLTIKVEGESNLHMHWTAVELRQQIISGAYAEVRVLWQCVEVANLKV